MKRFLLFLSLLFVTILTACNLFGPTMDDFESNHLSTYYEAENMSNNRYVLLYYDSTNDKDKPLINQLLEFFEDFSALEFYFLDTSMIESEVSFFGGYIDQPIIYVVSSKQVYEAYKGEDEIHTFLSSYGNITFDYDLFEDQHLSNFNDALLIQNDSYIIYYYLDNCPHCIAAKPTFLPWAFTKSVEDIYFINGAEVENPENFPTELIILNSGTPMLLVMSNGVFQDEYYEGTEAVVDYVNLVGTGDIRANVMSYDYSDFSDHFIDSFDDSLTISDNVYIEYYYSPYCSHCNSVKPYILTFFMNHEEVEFYLINASSATGIPKIESFQGVPSLYIIAHNEVVFEAAGSTNVMNFIEDYLNGNIVLTDYE